jgi:hypothetical protein
MIEHLQSHSLGLVHLLIVLVAGYAPTLFIVVIVTGVWIMQRTIPRIIAAPPAGTD